MRKRQFNDKSIAGIMENIFIETGGTFDYQTKQKGGNWYGLFQFDFLNKYYQKWTTTDSAANQIEFMHYTIYKDTSIIG